MRIVVILSIVFIHLLSTAVLSTNYKIIGRVINADSIGISGAEVRLPGFEVKVTNPEGYFEFTITGIRLEDYFPEGAAGIDMYVECLKSAKSGQEVAKK